MIVGITGIQGWIKRNSSRVTGNTIKDVQFSRVAEFDLSKYATGLTAS